jgi:hypothetical protein
MGNGFPSRSSSQRFPEYVRWTLHRGSRGSSAVWAALRVLPNGIELRHFMDGELLWSQLFPKDDGEELRRALNAALEAWLGRGWKPNLTA